MTPDNGGNLPELQLVPGTLGNAVKHRTQMAIASGALQSIPTDYEVVEQAGIAFLVRILKNLDRKEQEKRKQEKQKAKTGKDFNPFLPYEEALFVADLTSTHLCLLNKFNVVDHHLLMITRQFEEQDRWLTFEDFLALWLCLREMDGLAFYNGGAEAGASQRHKHLQLVPFSLVPDGTGLPITPVITQAALAAGMISTLPFQHGIAALNLALADEPTIVAQHFLSTYHQLLHATGLIAHPAPTEATQSAPYNLLITREWMFLVPRSQDNVAGISVNSLGFAGALLVRNATQMQTLKMMQPLSLLQQVAIAKS
jgi:ATP adenylyltransferase